MGIRLEQAYDHSELIIQDAVKEEILNPKVSVIIPVYNTEKYLFKCLMSVVQQTLKEIEIIIVNDGSTDNSNKIIKNFADNDSRIKVIKQKNQKQGAARNSGIKAAIGEYIGFIDSDDYIDPDFFEKLYLEASKNDADIACVNILKHKGEYKKYNVKYAKKLRAVEINKKIKLCSDKKGRFFYCMNKIYKTSVLKGNKIFFPENCLHEDVPFAIKVIYFSKRIISLPDIAYHYVQRPDSTCKSKDIREKRGKDRIFVYKEMQNFAYEHSIELPERMNYYRSYWRNPFIKTFVGLYKVKSSLFGLITIPDFIFTVLRNILSIKSISAIRLQIRIFGAKINIAKPHCWFKRIKTPYLEYKKNNINITTLPKATGQIRGIQLANLALLKELDYVCRQNNLQYWLDGGTLLGAIRHRGYIPWDDDIDTGMARPDYEKIIEAFKKSSRNPDIYADYHWNKNAPSHYFIKIKHKKCPYLFVDIFPFDTYGEKLSDTEQIEKTKEIKAIRNKFKKCCEYHNLEKEDVGHILYNTQKNILKKSATEHSDFVWGIDFNHSWKNWFTRYDVLFPLKTIEFEGMIFPCINNPDAYLKRLYGGYMNYPRKIGFGHSMYSNLNKEEKRIIGELINREHK